MSKYFGTDGFRGEAGRQLTALHAFRIGQLLGYYLKNEKKEAVAIATASFVGRTNYLYLRFLAASDFFFLFTLGFS